MSGAAGERPVPAQRAPDLGQHREILVGLLEVERARLQEALRIERARSMIFPETTVIVRDIQRLSAAVYGGAVSVEAGAEREGQEQEPPDCDPLEVEGPVDLAQLRRELGG